MSSKVLKQEQSQHVRKTRKQEKFDTCQGDYKQRSCINICIREPQEKDYMKDRWINENNKSMGEEHGQKKEKSKDKGLRNTRWEQELKERVIETKEQWKSGMV